MCLFRKKPSSTALIRDGLGSLGRRARDSEGLSSPSLPADHVHHSNSKTETSKLISKIKETSDLPLRRAIEMMVVEHDKKHHNNHFQSQK